MEGYIYERKIYNEEIKEQFFEYLDISEDTRETYKYIYYQAYEAEIESDKDIFDFDTIMLNDFFNKYFYPSEYLFYSKYNQIKNYILWAINNKLNTNSDDINFVKIKKIQYKRISPNYNYYTAKQIREIENNECLGDMIIGI